MPIFLLLLWTKRLVKVEKFSMVGGHITIHKQLPQPKQELKVVWKEHTRTSSDHSHTKKSFT